MEELKARGFFPEMPWCLRTTASVSLEPGGRGSILQSFIFRGMPYRDLPAILEKALDDALTLVRSQTREDVIKKGRIVGMKPFSNEEMANLESIGSKFEEVDPILNSFCAQAGLEFLTPPKGSIGRVMRIDRDHTIVLRTDFSIDEIKKRGASPDMPCSLEIHAGPHHQSKSRVILSAVPFPQLANVLEKGLEDCLVALKAVMPQNLGDKGGKN